MNPKNSDTRSKNRTWYYNSGSHIDKKYQNKNRILINTRTCDQVSLNLTYNKTVVIFLI